MSLLEKLRLDQSQALYAHDTVRLATLRMLAAAIKNREIEERKKDVGLADEEVLTVIQKEAKKRKDAIQEFERGGRADLAAVEAAELKILEAYLPAELSDDEVKRVVTDGVRELGGGGDAKQIGALMKIIMPTLKGRASGDRITRFAREALENS